MNPGDRYRFLGADVDADIRRPALTAPERLLDRAVLVDGVVRRERVHPRNTAADTWIERFIPVPGRTPRDGRALWNSRWVIPMVSFRNRMSCFTFSALVAATTMLVLAQAPLAAAAPTATAPAPDLKALIAQLDGRDCRYADDVHAPCTETPLPHRWLRWLDFSARYRCTLGAARCLGAMGPAAAPAVPALIRALTDGPNDYDTGDGFIATRSGVAAALGRIGDPRAIDPLAHALAVARPADRGPGALATREPAARHALIEALGRFGPAAGRHWQRAAAVLRERNADRGHMERSREQYERSRALDLVVDDHRKREPDVGSFAVSERSIQDARRRLDPAAPEYRRGFETIAHDDLASAAATALGAFGRTEAAPVLVRTLRNPAAAAAAAGALESLETRSDEALAALERVLADSTFGPVARSAAARALGRLGADRHARVLAQALADPETGTSAAKGLEALGPRATDAIPALVAVLEQPIAAQRRPGRVTYDIEATRRLGEKAAAVHALESIRGDRARAALRRFTDDADIGRSVRKALKRMERAARE